MTRGDGQLVLVVEDEPEVREIAVAFLKSLGYRTHAVGSAAEALARLEQDPEIALVFSDVMLGNGMDGHELARAARKLRPRLPILMTSGYNDPAAAEKSDGDHAFELLRKPYRRELLAEAVWRSLNVHA
jgi:CheY-like chemotaxis protein